MTAAYLQWGKAGEPMLTERAALRFNVHSKDDDGGYRVKVPGYGWRKLRYPTLREQIAGERSPYVILSGANRLSVTIDYAQGDKA